MRCNTNIVQLKVVVPTLIISNKDPSCNTNIVQLKVDEIGNLIEGGYRTCCNTNIVQLKV